MGPFVNPTPRPPAPAEAGPRRFRVESPQHGLRLDVALADLVGGDVSRSQLTRQITEGAVEVDGVRCPTPSRKLKAGQVITWAPPAPREAELAPEAIALRVLFEDSYLVVLDKPAGMVVHPAPGHEGGTLVNALLAHCKDLRGIGGELRPGIVHRLDKDTSGVMVVAKDELTLTRLGAAFKAHDIERVYHAIGVGKPPSNAGRVETLHGRDPHDRKKFSIKVKRGRVAVTNWRWLEPLGGASLLEAQLETGRTHQVRLHFAALGCPLLGDPLYARPPREPEVRALARTLGRQALHARVLGFTHPRTQAPLRFETEPPADFQAALAGLRQLAG
ncbi:MAG: RluA family pseudouridine synthase [Myxococcales bacterium]|nr:RluA family pseudouridine synthase [Myxococcales bacterium]